MYYLPGVVVGDLISGYSPETAAGIGSVQCGKIEPKEVVMFKKIGSAVVALAPLSVFAAVPTEVSTAIAGVQTDATSVAGLMVGVTAALLVFVYIRKLLK